MSAGLDDRAFGWDPPKQEHKVMKVLLFSFGKFSNMILFLFAAVIQG